MNDRIETPQPVPNREGFALVTTLLIVLVLSVLAVAVAWMATSEKKISFNEGVHMRSVYAADAGGEASINFLRLSTLPPQIVNFADSTVAVVGQTAVAGSQNYNYNARYAGWDVRPGWDVNMYRDFNYSVESTGRASVKGQSEVDLLATRLFKVGY